MPADFGLIAMASPVYGFVYLFQDLGLGLATVQRPNITHAQVNFFLWLLCGQLLSDRALQGWTRDIHHRVDLQQ